MRIGVMAAGAVGGYFGGRLAAAGHDVVLIARGANLAALRKDGLTIKSVKGDLHLPKVNATDDPKSVAPVDIVLFAVKLWTPRRRASSSGRSSAPTRASSPCRTASTRSSASRPSSGPTAWWAAWPISRP